jgi:predicted RNA-binding Zn-ribbon protein involved in translation (DUF1610 family)
MLGLLQEYPAMTEPRTPRQFAEAKQVILVACRCGHEKVVEPMLVEFTHGEHFDIVANVRELSNAYRCEACGAHRPIISWGPQFVHGGARDDDLYRIAG